MTRGTDPAAGAAEGRSWPAQHRNQLAGLGAAAVVLAGGVLAFMPHQQHAASHTVAADCGLVHCSATLPVMSSTSPGPGGPGQPGKTPGGRPSASASTHPASATPQPARAAAPSPVPTVVRATAPPPPPPPPVAPLTVSYTVVQSQNSYWGTRFVGRFTLVNHTGAAITGWALQAGLANGWAHWVSTSAGGYPWYQDWSPVRGGLVISGPRSSEAVPAHGAVVLYFSAEGASTGLSGCTINGSSC